MQKMSSPYRILFKYPSRGRIDRFFQGLNSIYENLYDTANFHVACTLDKDDSVMNSDEFRERIKSYGNLSVQWGLSDSKVHAINRDMPEIEWDIVVVMSDDMRVTFYGFDQIIREQFDGSLDFLLHIPDNDAKDILATMYIAGKDFYSRFNYIYHPSYKSLFCDNEIQEIAQKLGRYKFVNCPGLIFHANPAYGHHAKDAMFLTQQEIGWTVDQQNYNERKANNFYL